MDTREKIVSPDQIPTAGAIRVEGYFDPLTAEMAEGLEAMRRDGMLLIAVVRQPTDPVLPLRARQELVAALRCVDYVVTEGPADLSMLDDHRRRLENLVEHVEQRHRP